MAAVSVYVPVYMEGADGKKAFELVKLSGTLTTGPGNTVAEGEPMISSGSMTVTPPAALQPKGNA